MSERGVFAVDRGIFDHPIFAPEPFTEREAWLWMLSAAAWTSKRVRIGKAMLGLKRGQLAFATRFLATKWKWAHSKVVRFLKKLKTDTMIETLAKREATLITICNYDIYQFGGNINETQVETPTETEVKRKRNKEEETNNYNKEESKKDGADAPPDPAIAERDFFVRGKQVLGKSSGGLLAKLLKAKGNVALARSALETASTKQNPSEYVAAASRGPPTVRATTVYQQRQVESREILNEIDQSIARRSSAEDSFALRDNPGDGRALVRSGSGAAIIDLPAITDRSRG